MPKIGFMLTKRGVMKEKGYGENRFNSTQNTTQQHSNGLDAYRMFCFVEHLDTCQNISAMAIMYKDRLDRMNDFRKSNIRSER